MKCQLTVINVTISSALRYNNGKDILVYMKKYLKKKQPKNPAKNKLNKVKTERFY